MYMSYSIEIRKGEPLTRKLFKAINEFILNISIFYDITKISCHDFLNVIKQNPISYFTTIEDNVQYATLNGLKEEEQKHKGQHITK